MAVLALQTILTIKTTECITCGCVIGMSETLYDERLRDHRVYSCPNGHEQHFTAKSDRDKLAEEQARHQSTLARLNEANAVRERLQRKLKRAHKGVCPECNRSFANLAAHMKCKGTNISDGT